MTDYFKEELSVIKNPIIKDIAEQGIALIPEYFYKMPASTTGKYHPSYTTGEDGLYKHVRAAVRLAYMDFRISDFTPDEQDMIIASLILHDGWKKGLDGSKFTTHTHPLVAAQVLRENIHVDTEEAKKFLELICENISTHMGRWNTSNWDSAVLPTPVTKMQKMVHYADYHASRKPIEFNFDVEWKNQ